MIEVIKIYHEYATECTTVATLSDALDEVHEGAETILIDLEEAVRYNYNFKGELEEKVELECEERY